MYTTAHYQISTPAKEAIRAVQAIDREPGIEDIHEAFHEYIQRHAPDPEIIAEVYELYMRHFMGYQLAEYMQPGFFTKRQAS